MNLKVIPTNKLTGVVELPASKSYSIRGFVIAACGGSSHIINPSNCEDAVVSKKMAQQLGAKAQKTSNGFRLTPKRMSSKPKRVDVNESGTALRFVLPLLCLKEGRAVVTGRGTLKGRPNKHLTLALRKSGVSIRGKGNQESIPVTIEKGVMKAGIMVIDGSLSSQFISGLLIATPQLKGDTELTIKGKKLVSSDYITMTKQVLSKAGVRITQRGQRKFYIKGRQNFKGLKNFKVPSDYGLAAFHLAAGSLTESNVTLKGNLDDSFCQADGQIISLLRKMGVRFKKTRRSIKLKGPFKLKGGSFSLKNCPDLVPIMAVLAMFARGKTTLTNIAHAKAKESDRISDLATELKKVGAVVKETSHSLTIIPQNEYKSNRVLNPHQDHRLAMAFAVLGLKIGATVTHIECVRKSYPDFVRDFKALRSTKR